jgi:hypothetical protein
VATTMNLLHVRRPRLALLEHHHTAFYNVAIVMLKLDSSAFSV